MWAQIKHPPVVVLTLLHGGQYQPLDELRWTIQVLLKPLIGMFLCIWLGRKLILRSHATGYVEWSGWKNCC